MHVVGLLFFSSENFAWLFSVVNITFVCCVRPLLKKPLHDCVNKGPAVSRLGVLEGVGN